MLPEGSSRRTEAAATRRQDLDFMAPLVSATTTPTLPDSTTHATGNAQEKKAPKPYPLLKFGHCAVEGGPLRQTSALGRHEPSGLLQKINCAKNALHGTPRLAPERQAVAIELMKRIQAEPEAKQQKARKK
jgi:hypothetical protein